MNKSPFSPQPQHYIIVGSGVFGLTTALSLSAQQPDSQITIIDRYEPPVPDGASVDSSRIIRADYADPVYAKMAREARELWLADAELKNAYHEVGMLLNTADGPEHRGYLDKCIKNVRSLGIQATELEGDDIMRGIRGPDLPESVKGLGHRGYLNPVSGFADARMGIEILYTRARLRKNVSFKFQTVRGLVWTEGDGQRRRVEAVETENGNIYRADTVIIATGAWQLPEVPLPTTATGQVIGYIELSEAEMEKYKDMPVHINFTTGWFCIPPYQGCLKVARHAEGYLNTQTVSATDGSSRTVSVPRTSMTHQNQQIPKEGEDALREGLATYLPELANRPFSNTRVCWYTDTPRADFLIDQYRDTENLYVATGGSGHGYKFLPILGDLILSVLQKTADAQLRQKFSFAEALEAFEKGHTGDGSRGKGDRVEWAELE